jgi:hypothetical protein
VNWVESEKALDNNIPLVCAVLIDELTDMTIFFSSELLLALVWNEAFLYLPSFLPGTQTIKKDSNVNTTYRWLTYSETDIAEKQYVSQIGE